MNAKFEKIINTFPALMEKLNKSSFITKRDLKDAPDQGIYVFYEDGTPIYVGRSRRLKTRLREHSQQSSGHTSATFAFNLAKKRAKELGIEINKRRKDLQDDHDFSPIYKETKDRVSKMPIKAIGIEDPITQTLFEVYASLELRTTEQNEWRTH